MLKKYAVVYLYLVYGFFLTIGFINNPNFFSHFSDLIIPLFVFYKIIQYKLKNNHINLFCSLLLAHLCIGFNLLNPIFEQTSEILSLNIAFIKPIFLFILFIYSIKLYKFNREIIIFSLLLGLNLFYQPITVYSLYGTISVKEKLYSYLVENNITPIQCDININCIQAGSKEELIKNIDEYSHNFGEQKLTLPENTFNLLSEKIKNTKSGTSELGWANIQRLNLDIKNEFTGLFIFNVDNGYLIYDNNSIDSIIENNLKSQHQFLGIITFMWLLGLIFLNTIHSYFRGKK